MHARTGNRHAKLNLILGSPVKRSKSEAGSSLRGQRASPRSRSAISSPIYGTGTPFQQTRRGARISRTKGETATTCRSTAEVGPIRGGMHPPLGQAGASRRIAPDHPVVADKSRSRRRNLEARRDFMPKSTASPFAPPDLTFAGLLLHAPVTFHAPVTLSSQSTRPGEMLP